MKIHELIDGGVSRDEGVITLKILNKIKRIRRLRERDYAKKLQRLSLMYGDRLAAMDQREIDLERDRLAFELEKVQAQIGLEIEKAEIDQDNKNHVHDRAMHALKHLRKKW